MDPPLVVKALALRVENPLGEPSIPSPPGHWCVCFDVGFGGFGGGEFGNDDALFGLGEADSVEPDIADKGGFDLDRDDLSNAPPPQANSFDMNGLNGALPEGGLGGGMVSPFFVN